MGGVSRSRICGHGGHPCRCLTGAALLADHDDMEYHALHSNGTVWEEGPFPVTVSGGRISVPVGVNQILQQFGMRTAEELVAIFKDFPGSSKEQFGLSDIQLEEMRTRLRAELEKVIGSVHFEPSRAQPRNYGALPPNQTT